MLPSKAYRRPGQGTSQGDPTDGVLPSERPRPGDGPVDGQRARTTPGATWDRGTLPSFGDGDADNLDPSAEASLEPLDADPDYPAALASPPRKPPDWRVQSRA